MSWFSKSITFICIVSFSGSMVVIGAMDIHKGLKPPSEQELQRADRLVKALRGDELFKSQARYDDPNKKLPERRIAKYVPDYDLRKIKKFLTGLIGGINSDEGDDGTSEDSDSAQEDQK